MTSEQAALYLGVSRSAILTAYRRGLLHGTKPGGRDLNFTPEDVENYRDNHRGKRGRPKKKSQEMD
jgi:excisionase family DNA binding protein